MIQDGDQPVAPVSFTAHGVYEIEAEDDKPGIVVAANVNASESNVRVVEGSVLEDALLPTGVKVLNRAGSMVDAIEDARRGRELAHLLLLLAIIVFAAQSILARYFTIRIEREESADLSTTLQMSQVAAARRS